MNERYIIAMKKMVSLLAITLLATAQCLAQGDAEFQMTHRP